MGLLAECRFCRQYFSSKGLDEHIRRAHFKEVASAEKKAQRLASATQPKKKSVTGGEPSKEVLPLKAVPALVEKDIRVIQAEREQQVRRRMQAEANKTTAAYVTNGTLKRLNRAPLNSVWQEQVAKLVPMKEELSGQSNYVVHLQSVPVRKMPSLARKVAPGRSNKKKKQSSAQTVAATARAQVSVPCSCGGENERCFRCFGTGYFEVSPDKAVRLEKQSVTSSGIQHDRPAGFASDERGGVYGLREHGRFGSTPISDEYDEDSTS